MENTQELQHHYGSKVHILESPFLQSVLARLCHPDTYQPRINQLVETLYFSLVQRVIDREFVVKDQSWPTRMTQAHPDKKLEAQWVDGSQRAVCVNIARAGTYPSHICYQSLHHAIEPENIRQDHIFASRLTDDREKVQGSELAGTKIGGGIDKAIVLFPDPMGATGNTIVSAIDLYKNKVSGEASKFIALHLIVTPEYLKAVTTAHPEAEIYAVRLDRGMSSADVLQKPPGLHWDLERGLNDKDYIVPGGGGFGEIMNNSFV